MILKMPAPPASPHNIPAPLGGAGKIKMRRDSIAPVIKQYAGPSEIFQKILFFLPPGALAWASGLERSSGPCPFKNNWLIQEENREQGLTRAAAKIKTLT
jgi:hypothetical protein